jgi:hypothetical protein
MEASFDYLLTATDAALGYPQDEYRLVQQWMWYMLATDPYAVAHASNLADPTLAYALTIPGQRWQAYATGIAPVVNLFPVEVPVSTGSSANGTDPATLTLSVDVINNGNTESGPATVTFYSDAAMTQVIGSGALSSIGGCGRRRATATATWANVPSGVHSFWVKVDSNNAIPETSEDDNTIQGFVIANPNRYFLPIVTRCCSP